MEFKLVEIFKSLQGEGRNTGRQCIFVRFAGCNLSCAWCDTAAEARFAASLESLVDEISSFSCRNVILTGGEPTIVQGMDRLVAELKKRGFWIAVETNGTRSIDDAPWLAFVDYIACSPKIEYESSVRIAVAGEVRVVASAPPEQTAAFCRRMRARISAGDYYVSPCERAGEIDFAGAKAALALLPDWSLSVQLHKILGFR